MAAGGASSPGTYSLSSIYRALGIRDARVLPEVGAGMVVPVVVFGQFEAFAPEVVEARAIINAGVFNILANQWVGLAMHSIAPGGSIIEAIAFQGAVELNTAPQRPFVGANLSPFSIGGQALLNLFELTVLQIGATVRGDTLGGSGSPFSSWGEAPTDVVSSIWVPAGWWFWASMLQNAGAQVAMRVREIGQAQGPA